MSFTRWLRSLQSSWQSHSTSGNGRRAARSRPAPGYRPRLEVLENRCLMSVGALDTTFNPNGLPPGIVTAAMGAARAVAIQTDGKIVAAATIGGQQGFGVARYNGNGSLDTSFNGTGTVTTSIGTSSYATDVALQSDGKIVVCGRAYSSGYQFAMARYTTLGALDQSFGQHGIVTSTYDPYSSGISYALAIQPDGKIVLAGSASSSAGSGIGLARFNSDGSLDRTFGKSGWVVTPYTVVPGASQLIARDVAIDSAGRLVVEGYFASSTFVARYNSAGSLDTSLGTTGVMALTQFYTDPNNTHVALQADGKIVFNGEFEVIRLNPDGSLDTTSFGPLNPDGSHAGYVVNPGGMSPWDAQFESDGKIVVAGYGGNGGFGVVRLLSDGNLDPSFGGGGISQLENSVYNTALAIQPADGNIVLAGASPAGFGLARFVGDTPAPPVAATRFVVSAPSNVAAGSSFNVTVIASDASGTVAVSYTGTVSLTSTSATGIVTALGSYTFTATDLGAHTFSVTLPTTVGTWSLTATDGNGLLGTDPSIVVSAAAASRFVFTAYPASVSVGTPFSVTITVTDAYGNVVTGYTDTVPFTNSIGGASLPKDYTFTASDRGVHTFTGLVLRKKGVQALTITDLANSTVFGTISVAVV